jgi:hypothetical protein
MRSPAVTPAKAGIHEYSGEFMDSGIRRNDAEKSGRVRTALTAPP